VQRRPFNHEGRIQRLTATSGDPMNLHFFARAASATLLAVTALETQAQDATRIVAATVYPDSARVERELKAPGGTRHVVIACLPAGVDLATLQVDGDPELRVGEIHATTLPTTRWPECTPSPLEARGQALEAKRALLEAQRDSNELALSYLRVWGASAHADDRAGTPAPAAPASKAVAKPAGTPRPGALAADLRQAAFDVLVDQARVDGARFASTSGRRPPRPCGFTTTSSTPIGGPPTVPRWIPCTRRCASTAKPTSCKAAARTGARCA
jgi:hypothetical protein